MVRFNIVGFGRNSLSVKLYIYSVSYFLSYILKWPYASRKYLAPLSNNIFLFVSYLVSFLLCLSPVTNAARYFRPGTVLCPPAQSKLVVNCQVDSAGLSRTTKVDLNKVCVGRNWNGNELSEIFVLLMLFWISADIVRRIVICVGGGTEFQVCRGRNYSSLCRRLWSMSLFFFFILAQRNLS